MARRCPIYGSTVLYLDCLECEEKICRGNNNGTNTNKQRDNNNQNNGLTTLQEDIKEDAVDETSEVW